MNLKRIINLVKEKRKTNLERLEEQGFRLITELPTQAYDIYGKDNVRVLYDREKDRVICGQVD